MTTDRKDWLTREQVEKLRPSRFPALGWANWTPLEVTERANRNTLCDMALAALDAEARVEKLEEENVELHMILTMVETALAKQKAQPKATDDGVREAALTLLKRFPPDDAPCWAEFGGASIWLDTEEHIALTRALTPAATQEER